MAAALEMVAGVAEAGLPPAHVGLHARPGEVVVSQAVVVASGDAGIHSREIGPVELKGVAGAVRLHTAPRPG